MNTYHHQHGGDDDHTPSMVTVVDPYVYQTLQTIVGKKAVIQTMRDSVTGIITTVMPDHIVVDVSGSLFFVRTQQIIWVKPY